MLVLFGASPVVSASYSRTFARVADKIRLHSNSNQVVVSIANSGVGIGEKDKDVFSEPFFSTKSTGTGIGLTICQSIIECHGEGLRASAEHSLRGDFLKLSCRLRPQPNSYPVRSSEVILPPRKRADVARPRSGCRQSRPSMPKTRVPTPAFPCSLWP